MFDLPLFEALFMTFYSASAVGLRHGCWWMPIALVLRWVSMRWIPQHLQSWSSSSKHPRFAAELPCGDFFVLEFSFEVEKQMQKCLVDFFLRDLIWRVFFLDEQWDLFNFWVIAHAVYEASACFFLGPTHSSAKLYICGSHSPTVGIWKIHLKTDIHSQILTLLSFSKESETFLKPPPNTTGTSLDCLHSLLLGV